MVGKFGSCASPVVGQLLWGITLDGHHDDEIGSVDESGWYGLILDTGIPSTPHAIIHEDTDGFVDYVSYDTDDDALEAWHEIEETYYAEDLDTVPDYHTGATVYPLWTMSDAAKGWVARHVDVPDYAWSPLCIVVGHRYIDNIVDAMLRDGLIHGDDFFVG